MLKYCYWRTVEPQQDWMVERDLHPIRDNPDATTPPRQQCQSWYEAAEMFYWLRGKLDEFYALMGGEGWPHGYPVAWKPEGVKRFPKRVAQ